MSICTPMFTVAFLVIAKRWKQRRCSSVNEWIKMRYIDTIEYNYSAIKKNKMLPFVTWMD